jgi:hypothetical protein
MELHDLAVVRDSEPFGLIKRRLVVIAELPDSLVAVHIV